MFPMYLQVYFLMVLLNGLAGLSLAMDLVRSRFPTLAEALKWTTAPTAKIVLGIMAFGVGFWGLMAVLPGDLPVIGDLIPSLTAMFSGTGLVLEFYRTKSDSHSQVVERLDGIIVKNKMVFGSLGVGAGVVHFFIPNWIFV